MLTTRHVTLITASLLLTACGADRSPAESGQSSSSTQPTTPVPSIPAESVTPATNTTRDDVSPIEEQSDSATAERRRTDPALSAKGFQDVLPSLTLPAGTCDYGRWEQHEPITLSDGRGEVWDSQFDKGASIMDAEYLGAHDFTDDGVSEQVAIIRCSGTPIAHCCAGGVGSSMQVVLVFAGDQHEPTLLGSPIWPLSEGAEGPYYFHPDQFELSQYGLQTVQSIIDDYYVMRTVTYDWNGKTWERFIASD